MSHPRATPPAVPGPHQQALTESELGTESPVPFLGTGVLWQNSGEGAPPSSPSEQGDKAAGARQEVHSC